MSTPIVVMIDDDDPAYKEYLALTLPDNYTIWIGKRAGLSEIYNRVFHQSPDLDWYGVFADDVVPETEDWDTMLIEAAGKYGLAFGHDRGFTFDKATHFCLGGELVRETGWLALPGLDRIYIDTVWNDIANKRGVLRQVPVQITHHHFSNRLAPMDETYGKHNKDADKKVYDNWLMTF